ncbi:S41 family peptidase [Solitalea sp. MAHUQ-68]|uniref:S41 family peptidase n=1 Tax=Solitalea agri TaxID=2953739 RepID=A0A9X2F2E2_9SPHI|nr:S41 family peptidase [Solitalea agri]MCO4292971.1 S41 family peptidase [Solitalea agri]
MNKVGAFFRSPRNIFLTAGIGAGLFLSFKAIDEQFEITKNLDIFAGVYREINLNYVDKVDPAKLINTASNAIDSSLDPYTEYIPESDIETFKMNYVSNEYGGIGALILQKNNKTYVSETYEGFPAQKADIRAGDQMLSINGVSLDNKSNDEVSELLKGANSSALTISILRTGETKPIEKKLARAEIKFPNVSYSGILTNQVGYIKLDRFLEGSALEVKDAFLALKKKYKITALVLDLRGNGGGILQEAVKIVNYFVAKGETVVTQKGRLPQNNYVYHAGALPLDNSIPLVVLVDDGTASASEIVAGAMQDLDRGVIIGQQSFGKGLVQQTLKLPYNSLLKITIAKYYTPSGRCIQKIDYLHKNTNGQAINIADSLISEFRTKNGRVVYDGRGITPDVYVKPYYFSSLAAALIENNLIFDYGTTFRLKNNSIKQAREFRIRPNEYNEFVEFVNSQSFSYSTQSDKLLEDLEKVTKKEKYFDQINEQYEVLKFKAQNNRKDDLVEFKPEISQLLENEIVSRYYYQRGRIESSFKYDIELNEALKLFTQKVNYYNILKGTGDYKTIGKNSELARKAELAERK